MNPNAIGILAQLADVPIVVLIMWGALLLAFPVVLIVGVIRLMRAIRKRSAKVAK